MICSNKVCIILVNYNSQEETIECLDSLSEISYPNYEVIVVDNGSNECSSLREYINDKSNMVLIETGYNGGFAAGNNVGIRKGIQNGADYLLLVNNDTIVNKECVNHLVEFSKQHPLAGIVCGKIYFFNPSNMLWFAGGEINFDKGRIRHFGYKELDNGQYDKPVKISFATGCLMLIPSKVINDVGLLKEDYFLYGEDADYSCRVTNCGYEIWYDPKAFIFHKVGASAGSNGKATQYYSTRNDFYVFAKYAPERKKRRALAKLLFRKMKEVFSGVLNYKWVYKGLCDYKKGVSGKVIL